MIRGLALDNFFGMSVPNRQTSAVKRFTVSKPSPWQKWAAVFLVAVSVLILADYLVSVNSYASTGYEIKKLQNHLAGLTEANQKLTVKVAQVSSMITVQSQVLGADFVPAGTPQFLQVNQLSKR